MIDPSIFDKQCPRCSGLGKLENPAWLNFWTNQDRFQYSSQTLEINDFENTTLNQPTEPMFFVCKKCHGRGKILTAEGKKLIEFVRYWMNPNY